MTEFLNMESSGVRADKLNEMRDAIQSVDNKISNTDSKYDELNETFQATFKSMAPLSSYIETPGGITADNSWTGIGSDTTTHIAIPVSSEDIIVVTANDTEVALISFLKTYSIPKHSSDLIDFSEETGYTSRFYIRPGITETMTVPTDVTYMVVEKKWSGRESLPSSLLINGYDISKSLIDNIDTLQNGLDEVLSSKDDLISDISSLWGAYTTESTTRKNNDTTLNSKINDEISYRKSADANLSSQKMSLPSANDYGSAGQMPRSTGSGIEWVDYGFPTDEQTERVISNWLDTHPKATTTVQDGAVSLSKLDNDLNKLIDSFANNGKFARTSQSATAAEVQALIDSGEYDGLLVDSDLYLGNNPLMIPSNFVLKGSGGTISFDDIAIRTIPEGIDPEDPSTSTYIGELIETKNLLSDGKTVPYTEGDRRIYLADGQSSSGLLGKTLRFIGSQDLLSSEVDEEYRLGSPTGSSLSHKECHAGTYSEVVGTGSDENGSYIIIAPELQWYYGELIVNEWLPCKNVLISDLILRCNRSASSDYTGMINIVDADNVLVENCQITGINIMCVAHRSQHVTVRGCWFNVNVDDYDDPDFYKNNVMKIAGSLYCTVEQCHFSGSAQCVDITFSYEGPFSYGCVVRDNYMFGSRNTTTTHPGTAACTISGNRMLSLRNGMSIRGQRHIVKGNTIKFIGASNDAQFYGINWDEGYFRRSVCHGNTLIGFGTAFSLKELFDMPNERYSVYPSSVGINITGNVVQDCMVVLRIYRYDGLSDGSIATEITKQDAKLNVLFSGNLVLGTNPVGAVSQSLLTAQGVITATNPDTYTRYNSVSNILIQNNAIFTQGDGGSQTMRIVNSTIPIKNLVIANNDFGDRPVYLGYLGDGINGSTDLKGSAVDCTFFNNKYRVVGRVATGESFAEPKNAMSGNELPACADIGSLFFLTTNNKWYRFEINRSVSADSWNAVRWVEIS